MVNNNSIVIKCNEEGEKWKGMEAVLGLFTTR
jgi:hypothetical protein